jgi:hypothetical protein
MCRCTYFAKRLYQQFLEEWVSLDLQISLLGVMGVALFCFATGILFWPNKPFTRLSGFV